MKKILYILSLALVGIGVVTAIVGPLIIGLLSASIGGVLAISTFVGGKLIDASQQATFDKGNESLEMKINNQISESRRNQFKAESEIRRLKSWSNDAIFSAYSEVANKEGVLLNRDTLYDNYDTIHQQLGAKVGFEVEDKCDNLVKDYRNKIKGYEERIEIFTKKQEEYLALKNKMKAVKQHERMMQKLENHDKHLEQADQSEINSIAASEYDLSQLTMGNLEQEVLEREEYYKQLEETKFLEKL